MYSKYFRILTWVIVSFSTTIFRLIRADYWYATNIYVRLPAPVFTGCNAAEQKMRSPLCIANIVDLFGVVLMCFARTLLYLMMVIFCAFGSCKKKVSCMLYSFVILHLFADRWNMSQINARVAHLFYLMHAWTTLVALSLRL